MRWLPAVLSRCILLVSGNQAVQKSVVEAGTGRIVKVAVLDFILPHHEKIGEAFVVAVQDDIVGSSPPHAGVRVPGKAVSSDILKQEAEILPV